jgi:CubicO group peptidase (beta-lactamase class C family)
MRTEPAEPAPAAGGEDVPAHGRATFRPAPAPVVEVEPEDAPPGKRSPNRNVLVALGAMVLLGILAIFLATRDDPDLPATRAHRIAALYNRVTDDSVPAGAIDSIETLVGKQVRGGAFPGAAFSVGVRDREMEETGLGRLEWGKTAPPVDPDGTMYDLASLTKVVGTTAAVMALVDDGKMGIDDHVSKYLPTFTGEGREKVTIRHLLTHTSGLSSGAKLKGSSRGERLAYYIAHAPIYTQPGKKVVYSDGGFIILAEAAERAAHEPLSRYLQHRVYAPLGMTATRWQPGAGCAACAPTLTLKDGKPFRGKTNDPISRDLGGVSGNAGLFSTAHDVGRFAAMIANGGELDGVRVLKPATVAEFTHAQPKAGTRGLGWEIFCREGTVPDAVGCKEPYAYGHTGYTGTSMWIDPVRGVWVVLLTNRTFNPTAPNPLRSLRRRIFSLAAAKEPPPPAVLADTTPDAR